MLRDFINGTGPLVMFDDDRSTSGGAAPIRTTGRNRKTQPVVQRNGKPTMALAQPARLSKNGREIRVGSIVMGSNDEFGEVTHVVENVVVFRLFPGQDINGPMTADFRHEDITVILNPDDLRGVGVEMGTEEWYRSLVTRVRVLADEVRCAYDAGIMASFADVRDFHDAILGLERADINFGLWLANHVRQIAVPGKGTQPGRMAR